MIDNDSSDGSADYIRKYFPDGSIRVISNSENNYTAGLNIGLDKADAGFVLYLNNDVEVDPGFVKPLVDCMRADEIGIVQCKLLNARIEQRIDSLGEEIGFLGYHRSLWAGELNSSVPKEPFEIPCTNGSAFMARKQLLVELGGFDERYYSGYEDVNLSLSARALGYRIISNPKSVVYHRRGTTALSTELRGWTAYHFAKNRLITLLKFHRSRDLLIVSSATGVIYFLEFLWLSLHRREVKAGVAKLRAFFWVWQHIDYVVRERQRLMSIRKTRNLEIRPWIFPFNSNART
jgi:GT2 family glycosyltransferase